MSPNRNLAAAPELPIGLPDEPADAAAEGSPPRTDRLFAEIEAQIGFLRRAARRWCRDPADADDLVQDTLVQALANARLWQPGSDLRAWLFTIMRNRALAGISRSSRSAAWLQNRAAFAPGAADDSREARLVLRDVGAALSRLPKNQRLAVMLAGIEEKSYQEVAAAMGLSVDAVRCHLARGRDRLRAAVHGADTRSPWAASPGARAPTAKPVRPAFAERSPALAFAMAD